MATVPPDSGIGLESLRLVVESLAGAHSLDEQLDRMLSHLRVLFNKEVCSVYLQEGSQLRLYRNVGLGLSSADGNVSAGAVVPLESSLVGEVARTQTPLNLSSASSHPSYCYLEGSGEEAFDAFLGVPLVRNGITYGVLVIQDRAPNAFSSADEAFLVTIAACLSMELLTNGASSEASVVNSIGSRESGSAQRTYSGVGAVLGQGAGQLCIVLGARVLQVVDEAAAAEVDTELAQLDAAVQRTLLEIDSARAALEGSVATDVLAVFDVYKRLLAGGDMTEGARNRIHQGQSAFNAVREGIDLLMAAFDGISDDYLRARGEDVRYLGDRLLANLLGVDEQVVSDLQDVVLIGDAISVSDIARFQPGQLAGIVCFSGSKLSHTAVLAGALGIPTVMATGPIEQLRESEQVIVDGDQGLVILAPLPATLAAYLEQIAERNLGAQELDSLAGMPAVTRDGVAITLLANTGLLADANPGLANGAQGVGLYRSELPFMARASLPTEEEQLEIYRSVLRLYDGKPVVMRILDVGGDKQLPYLSITEENPALGWRGIRFLLDNKSILRCQLRAMLRASAIYNNLRLLVPMVGAYPEFREFSQFLEEVFSELIDEGYAIRMPDIGVMVEVPAVISILPQLAPHIDFLSVGTNDLTQFLLAADRNNERVAKSFDWLHPAVIDALRTIQQTAQQFGLPVSVCGELAADPLGALVLLALGYRSLSMSAGSIPAMKNFILEIEMSDIENLARTDGRPADSMELRARADTFLQRRAVQLATRLAQKKRT